MFLFRSVSVQLSSRGSSSGDYELRRTRELFRDLDRKTLARWMEETKETSSSKEGHIAAGSSAGKPTLVGSINTGRAFSHNMQGPIPPVLDLSSFPAAEEAIRVADEFCDKYRALRKEVDILREENNRLRKMLGNFLTPIVDTPPPPKE